MVEHLKGVRSTSIPPTAGIGWNAGLIMECKGTGCPCKRGQNVHPPVLMVFDATAGEYVRSECRCTARWAAAGEGFSAGQICGRRVTHNVADLWVCEQHFKRLRWWMHDRDGRTTDALRHQAREEYKLEAEFARERDQKAMQHQRELAAQQRELDRQRVLAEEAARAESSVVYYAQRSDGLIKIGTSRNLEGRLVTLKRDHGPLKLLLTHGGGHKQEHEMHVQFKALRVEGEWFTGDLPLIEHIASMRKAGDDSRPPGLPECVSRRIVNGMLNRARAAARLAGRNAAAA
jgi:hypothetical protein